MAVVDTVPAVKSPPYDPINSVVPSTAHDAWQAFRHVFCWVRQRWPQVVDGSGTGAAVAAHVFGVPQFSRRLQRGHGHTVAQDGTVKEQEEDDSQAHAQEGTVPGHVVVVQGRFGAHGPGPQQATADHREDHGKQRNKGQVSKGGVVASAGPDGSRFVLWDHLLLGWHIGRIFFDDEDQKNRALSTHGCVSCGLFFTSLYKKHVGVSGTGCAPSPSSAWSWDASNDRATKSLVIWIQDFDSD